MTAEEAAAAGVVKGPEDIVLDLGGPRPGGEGDG
jgi:hypothetical protein